MIRTFWFAAVCLAALGGLLATRVTASMALTGDSVIDPATLGEGLAKDRLQDKPKDKFKDKLTKDELTKDTLTKADRLDIAYRQTGAVVIANVPTKSLVLAETTPDASATAGSQSPTPSHVNRARVMLPRPRPKNAIRLAKISHPVIPALDVETCSQPEGLSGILMSFSSQPRCG